MARSKHASTPASPLRQRAHFMEKLEPYIGRDDAGKATSLPTHAEIIHLPGGRSLARYAPMHGGWPKIRKRLRLPELVPRPPPSRLADRVVLLEELKPFWKRHPKNRSILGLASKPELEAAKRYDLAHAIETYHGGFVEFKKSLKVPVRPHAPSNNWTHLKRALEPFVKLHPETQKPVDLATEDELRQMGRGDLVWAVQKHGGFMDVRRKLGIRHPLERWENLVAELEPFLTRDRVTGEVRKLAGGITLRGADRPDLVYAIAHYHDGPDAVRRKLNAWRRGGFRTWPSLRRALEPYVERQPGTGEFVSLPGKEWMQQRQLGFLASAIERQGGFIKIREKLSTEPPLDGVPRSEKGRSPYQEALVADRIKRHDLFFAAQARSPGWHERALERWGHLMDEPLEKHAGRPDYAPLRQGVTEIWTQAFQRAKDPDSFERIARERVRSFLRKRTRIQPSAVLA